MAEDIGEAFIHGANDGADSFFGEMEELGGTAHGGTCEAEGFRVTRELQAEEHIGRELLAGRTVSPRRRTLHTFCAHHHPDRSERTRIASQVAAFSGGKRCHFPGKLTTGKWARGEGRGGTETRRSSLPRSRKRSRRNYFLAGGGVESSCLSFCSMMSFSCSLVSFGKRKAIWRRMPQLEAPAGWTALP